MPGEQQQVTNIYDCSTDSMHLERRRNKFFIEVEYVLPCTQTQHIVEGYGPGVTTVLVTSCASSCAEVPEHVSSSGAETWQQFLYIDLLLNRIRLELCALLD